MGSGFRVLDAPTPPLNIKHSQPVSYNKMLGGLILDTRAGEAFHNGKYLRKGGGAWRGLIIGGGENLKSGRNPLGMWLQGQHTVDTC